MRPLAGKYWGVLDTGVDNIHDYRGDTWSAHYLQSLTEDDTDKEDFVWLNGDIKLGEEIERLPFKEGKANYKISGSSPTLATKPTSPKLRLPTVFLF